jgi:hypothetical protein
MKERLSMKSYHSFVACLILLASGRLMNSSAPAQCDCAGRCGYCVDGECYPNRQTFGFYETQWRRWPIEAPQIIGPVKVPMPVNPMLGPAVESPAPESESSLDPEFPHLKKRANSGSLNLTPPADLPPVELPAEIPRANPFIDEPKSERKPALGQGASTRPRPVPQQQAASAGLHYVPPKWTRPEVTPNSTSLISPVRAESMPLAVDHDRPRSEAAIPTHIATYPVPQDQRFHRSQATHFGNGLVQQTSAMERAAVEAKPMPTVPPRASLNANNPLRAGAFPAPPLRNYEHEYRPVPRPVPTPPSRPVMLPSDNPLRNR